MNSKNLLASFLVFSLTTMPVHASCQHGNPRSLDYIRRDDNRCEGIKSEFSVSSGLNLISLATRSITTLGNDLTLRVPRVGRKTPIVIVQAIRQRYLLDSIILPRSPDDPSYFSFSWSTYVLKNSPIPISADELRARAYIPGSQNVFVPVILGQPSNKYEFVLFAPRPARIPVFEISLNGRVVYHSSRNSRQEGEIIFTWDGRKAPAGRYQLNFVGEMEQFNGPPERFPVKVAFEHDPKWLK